MTNLIKQNEIPKAAIEASLTGNWNAVRVEDRLAFVNHLCESLGVPLVMNPFMFIQMQGRTVLYAPASAYQMIAGQKQVSTEILAKEIDQELMLFEVSVRAKLPDGRFSDNFAAVTLKGLSGADYANAKMKCVTKAQRRAIKSLIGLPIPDEDELEHIENRIEISSESIKEPQVILDVASTPKNVTDDELEVLEWRNKVVKVFLDQKSPFFGDNKAATKFVQLHFGRNLKDLNAVELEDLLAIYENTYFPDRDEVSQPEMSEGQLDLLKQNILKQAAEAK